MPWKKKKLVFVSMPSFNSLKLSKRRNWARVYSKKLCIWPIKICLRIWQIPANSIGRIHWPSSSNYYQDARGSLHSFPTSLLLWSIEPTAMIYRVLPICLKKWGRLQDKNPKLLSNSLSSARKYVCSIARSWKRFFL